MAAPRHPIHTASELPRLVGIDDINTMSFTTLDGPGGPGREAIGGGEGGGRAWARVTGSRSLSGSPPTPICRPRRGAGARARACEGGGAAAVRVAQPRRASRSLRPDTPPPHPTPPQALRRILAGRTTVPGADQAGARADSDRNDSGRPRAGGSQPGGPLRAVQSAPGRSYPSHLSRSLAGPGATLRSLSNSAVSSPPPRSASHAAIASCACRRTARLRLVQDLSPGRGCGVPSLPPPTSATKGT